MVDEQGYRKALEDDESLAIFLRKMAKFDRLFCELMNDRDDFTLKLEVHGNAGSLLHCRVQSDGFERPRSVEQKIERRLGKSRGR